MLCSWKRLTGRDWSPNTDAGHSDAPASCRGTRWHSRILAGSMSANPCCRPASTMHCALPLLPLRTRWVGSSRHSKKWATSCQQRACCCPAHTGNQGTCWQRRKLRNHAFVRLSLPPLLRLPQRSLSADDQIWGRAPMFLMVHATPLYPIPRASACLTAHMLLPHACTVYRQALFAGQGRPTAANRRAPVCGSTSGTGGDSSVASGTEEAQPAREAPWQLGTYYSKKLKRQTGKRRS